jgi:hypothetical protein
MSNELKLAHLAAYLPYGLKCLYDGQIKEIKCIRENFSIWWYITYDDTGETASPINNTCKPILRPMSDLHKPLQDNGNWTVPANYLYRKYDITDMEFNGYVLDPKYGYEVYQFLISHHFDVFGLIEQGLALSYEEAGA